MYGTCARTSNGGRTQLLGSDEPCVLPQLGLGAGCRGMLQMMKGIHLWYAVSKRAS